MEEVAPQEKKGSSLEVARKKWSESVRTDLLITQLTSILAVLGEKAFQGLEMRDFCMEGFYRSADL